MAGSFRVVRLHTKTHGVLSRENCTRAWEWNWVFKYCSWNGESLQSGCNWYGSLLEFLGEDKYRIYEFQIWMTRTS